MPITLPSWDTSTNNMQTKAELEAEIARLKLRVAELEGMVHAYEYALVQVPSTKTWGGEWWNPNTTWQFPTVTTTPNLPNINLT